MQTGDHIGQRRALTESHHVKLACLNPTLGGVRVHEADQRLGRILQILKAGTAKGPFARRTPGVAAFRRRVKSARGEEQAIGREVASENPHRVLVTRPAVKHQEQARGSPHGSPHAQSPVFKGLERGVICGGCMFDDPLRGVEDGCDEENGREPRHQAGDPKSRGARAVEPPDQPATDYKEKQQRANDETAVSLFGIFT